MSEEEWGVLNHLPLGKMVAFVDEEYELWVVERGHVDKREFLQRAFQEADHWIPLEAKHVQMAVYRTDDYDQYFKCPGAYINSADDLKDYTVCLRGFDLTDDWKDGEGPPMWWYEQWCADGSCSLPNEWVEAILNGEPVNWSIEPKQDPAS